MGLNPLQKIGIGDKYWGIMAYLCARNPALQNMVYKNRRQKKPLDLQPFLCQLLSPQQTTLFTASLPLLLISYQENGQKLSGTHINVDLHFPMSTWKLREEVDQFCADSFWLRQD